MRYFIGKLWTGGHEGCTGRGPLYGSAHWHWFKDGGWDGNVVDCTKFEAYESAEMIVAEALILHPDWIGMVAIETMGTVLRKSGGMP